MDTRVHRSGQDEAFLYFFLFFQERVGPARPPAADLDGQENRQMILRTM
jgi:hypothetical protein